MTVTSGTEHPARDLLEALASGGVEFDVDALLRSAPRQPPEQGGRRADSLRRAR